MNQWGLLYFPTGLFYIERITDPMVKYITVDNELGSRIYLVDDSWTEDDLSMFRLYYLLRFDKEEIKACLEYWREIYPDLSDSEQAEKYYDGRLGTGHETHIYFAKKVEEYSKDW